MKHTVAGLLLLGVAACGAKSGTPEFNAAYCLVSGSSINNPSYDFCAERDEYLIFRENGATEQWDEFRNNNRFGRAWPLDDQGRLLNGDGTAVAKLKPISGGFKLVPIGDAMDDDMYLRLYDGAHAIRLNMLFGETAGVELSERQNIIDRYRR